MTIMALFFHANENEEKEEVSAGEQTGSGGASGNGGQVLYK